MPEKNEMMQVRTPSEMVASIDKAAQRDLTTRSQYVRRAVLDRLRADGFEPMTRVA